MRHTGNAVILTDLDSPRIQFNSGYHDPTDPDADWTRARIHAAAAVLQHLIARRRP